MNFSVIIPSRNIDNLKACISALRKCEADCQIVVTWDASGGNSFRYEAMGLDGAWMVRIIHEPFIFARNVNMGIQLVRDDIVIMNDDALLKTAGGLALLQNSADTHPEYGLIASTSNNVGNRNQKPQKIGLRQDKMVCFVCVYIPRRTIDLIGLLDERFGGFDARGRTIYGWEDNDYCRRVRNAGLKVGIDDACFVDHATLPSTFRSGKSVSIEPGKDTYMAKWGSLD
jgi:GT2 family glycosyltransferase